MTTSGAILLAHRGASHAQPENTLAAFGAALDPAIGADGLELDVRLTRDGVPVVFHDDDTLRLTGEAGTIEERDLDAVRRLAVGGEPIPTLAEVLELFARRRPALPNAPVGALNVELKPRADAAALIDACGPLLAPFADRALVVSSFDPRVLSAAFDRGVPWRLAYLYETPLALRALAQLEPRGTVDLHPRHDLFDAAHVQGWSRPGRVFRVWTVDEPAEAARVIALGAGAVVSNRVERLRAAGLGGSGQVRLGT